MPPKPDPKPKFNTLITAGCIAKAAYDREQSISITTNSNNIMFSSLAQAPLAPPKKKRKTTVLPPPSEMAAEAARKAEMKKRPAKARKPLTTLGKQKAVESKKATQNKNAVAGRKPAEKKEALEASGEALESQEVLHSQEHLKNKKSRGAENPVENKKSGEAKKALEASKKSAQAETVVHDGVGLKVIESGLWKDFEGEGKGSDNEDENPRNLMSIMRGLGQMERLEESKGSKKGAAGRGGVKKVSVLVRPTGKTRRLKLRNPEGKGPVLLASRPGRVPRVGLMSLKLEVRKRIWELAVVETKFFVYPAVTTEQPDLAMTSKQIRDEVLPIFYGKNTFAIELLAAGSSLNLVQEWVETFEKTAVLGMIEKWAFVCTVPSNNGNKLAPKQPIMWRNAQDVIVTLKHPSPEEKKGTVPEIEIHEQALCILPGHDEFGQCTLKEPVTWLEDAIAATALGKQYNRGEQALRLARLLHKRGGELVGSRCHGARVEEEVFAADEIKAMNPADTAFNLYVARRCREHPFA